MIAFDRDDLFPELSQSILEDPVLRNSDDIAKPLRRPDVENVDFQHLPWFGSFHKHRTGHDGELLHGPGSTVVPVTEPIVRLHSKHLARLHLRSGHMGGAEGADNVLFSDPLHEIPSF